MPAKTCIVCRQDCSRVERFKDAAGAYTCAPCYKQSNSAPVPAKTINPIQDSAPFALADEDPAWLKDFKPQTLKNCPKCNALMSPGKTACLSCGHDTAPPAPRPVKVKPKEPKRPKVLEEDKVRGDSTPIFSDALIGRSLIIGVLAIIVGCIAWSSTHDAGKAVATAAIAFVAISIRWWLRSSIRGWFS